LQWATVMVMRWACAVNGGRCSVVTVHFNNCRSVVVGVDVVGIVFEGRWRWPNLLGVPNDDGFIDVNQGASTGGVRRMLGAGGGSGATLLSRRMWRVWMASILLGGASWMPAMAEVSRSVASMIMLVAVISGIGMA
jgi:hypothetical protein